MTLRTDWPERTKKREVGSNGKDQERLELYFGESQGEHLLDRKPKKKRSRKRPKNSAENCGDWQKKKGGGGEITIQNSGE